MSVESRAKRPAASAAGLGVGIDALAGSKRIDLPPDGVQLEPSTLPGYVKAKGSRRARALSGGLASMALLLALAAPAFSARAAPGSCGDAGVAVQVLGSGGPEMRGRASAAYLVWVDGKARVLVDAGGGSALRFGESGARVADFSLVLFTHFHSDHSADFPVLVKSSHFEQRPRKEPLPVLGPEGSELMPSASQFVGGMFAPGTGVFRYLGPMGNEQIYDLQPRDIALGAEEVRNVFDKDGLRVGATRVVHAKIPSLAFRVEVVGKAIVFTGDGNGNNGNLERIGRDVDLLVAHLAIDDGFHSPFGERTLHAPPGVIGRIAAETKARRLVLAHRRPETLGKEAHLRDVIAAQYKGPIEFADDLSCFPLPN